MTARLRKKKKRNLQKSVKQGAFWCKMWYLIKVFKNKMRPQAHREEMYMTLETGIRGTQSVLVTEAKTVKFPVLQKTRPSGELARQHLRGFYPFFASAFAANFALLMTKRS